MSDFSDNLSFTVEPETIKAKGDLKKVTDYTEFNKGNPDEQNGYYLPFKVTPKSPEDPVSVQVNEKPEVSSPEDNTFVVLLGADAKSGKSKTIKVKSGADTYTMDLSGLTLTE